MGLPRSYSLAIFWEYFGQEKHLMVPILAEVVAPLLRGVDMSWRGCGVAFDAAGLKDKDEKTCLDRYPVEWKESAVYLSNWIRYSSRLHLDHSHEKRS
jgi:hypothetical protein